MLRHADLPDDVDALRAIVLEQARKLDTLTVAQAEIERLRAIIEALQRHQFGRRSEQLDPDQLQLSLEEVETALAQVEAANEVKAGREREARPRKTNRGSLPAHLERIEQVVDVDDKACPCCGSALHQIGEDVAERLDVVPATFRVLVTRRPRVACPGGGRGLPLVRECGRPGSGTGADRRRRYPDRGADRAGSGIQVRRSPAPIPAGPDLRPARHPA